jgi:uncharacterized SAM-binding protein YcdF (DUF218 family)
MSMIFHPRPRRHWPLALFLAAAFAAWTVGLFNFAAAIPQTVTEPDRKTDAIVVLTGGSGRLGEGLALLAAGKAEKLFVSGVYRGVDVKRLLAIFKNHPAGLESRISIGNATDTIENAAETALWVAAGGYKSLRLVTSDYHMARSLLEFRYAMPGIALVPHPVFSQHVKKKGWWRRPGTASLIIGEYNKYLLAWTRIQIMSYVRRAG